MTAHAVDSRNVMCMRTQCVPSLHRRPGNEARDAKSIKAAKAGDDR